MDAVLSVGQRSGLGSGSFRFYATFGVHDLCSYIPGDTAVLVPASSAARGGSMLRPSIPAYITDRAADSGGFVASRVWGEYRYSLADYVQWCDTWGPQWAACRDYCCEPELEVVTRDRQDKTTAEAWQAWREYRGVSWAWVPTIQGLYPHEYRRHALELKPLIDEMQAYYSGSPAWRVGVGTLCRRAYATEAQEILNEIRGVLPGVGLHLWGFKLGSIGAVDMRQVVSTDSAVHHQQMYNSEAIALEAAAAGMSKRRYVVLVKLPEYQRKVYAAVESWATCQPGADYIESARAVFAADGWTLRIRTRRNRAYVYMARRDGKRVIERYVCAVGDLKQWLEGAVNE